MNTDARLKQLARDTATHVCFSDDPMTLRGVEFQIAEALSTYGDERAREAVEAACRVVCPHHATEDHEHTALAAGPLPCPAKKIRRALLSAEGGK